MDYKTFKGYVRRTGLEIREFAELVGMNQRSVSNYSKTGVVPEHLALIVFMMVELDRCGADLKEVFARLDKIGRRPYKRREGGFRGKRNAKGTEV